MKGDKVFLFLDGKKFDSHVPEECMPISNSQQN